MAEKKKSYNYVLTLAASAAGVVLVFSLAHILDQRFAMEREAGWPSELQVASSIEEGFQNEPEEPITVGSVRIPIFIYHSVRPYSTAIDPDELKAYEITPALFDKELQYLEDNGYTTLSMDQVEAYINAGALPDGLKPVVLTFDDGWHNQYKYAFPLLVKHHMTGTFYVYTNPIGKAHFLSWDEIRDMSLSGMEIASHSVSHPLFRKLTPAQITYEVTRSKKIIEAQIGKPVKHFATPYGSWNLNYAKIVADAGYETYRTTYKGLYENNPMRLTGILVTNSFDYFVKELVSGQ